jgi:uncharacterized protein YndB with AHSA1/START domain
MSSSVTVALRVKASPERAFDVFTGDIGLWWRPNVLFATTPRPPGVLAFQNKSRLVETLADGKVFEIGQVTAWERPSRLAFTWRQAAFPPDLATEVEVLFEPAGNETRVSIEHRGFDRVPADNAARHSLPDQVLLRHLVDWWRGELLAYGAILQ